MTGNLGATVTQVTPGRGDWHAARAEPGGRLRRRDARAARSQPDRAAGADRGAARRERCGQDDAAARCFRPSRRARRRGHQGRGHARRQADPSAAPGRGRPPGGHPGHGRPADLRRVDGRGEPRARRAHPPPARGRGAATGVRPVPGARHAPPLDRRLPVRRRAADAGHGARPDVRAALSAARRAEPGARATPGRAGTRPDRRHQQGRYGCPAGRAERHHGALDRRARVRAGDRQGRAGLPRRRPARRHRYPGVLPGAAPGGYGPVVPGREALQAAEAVAVMSERVDGAPILTFADVHLSFAGVRAIAGVSFEVGPRELFAVIGPNGAGKTSIFNVISGVYRPQSGRITFAGTDLAGLRPYRVAALGVARTFQNVELFQHLTVLENLMLGRHHHIRYGTLSAIAWFGRARREEIANRAVVEDIVDFLELEQWRRLPVGLLPYGVQKRVELGRALAMEPKLLLLDEPVSGMNL